jgi:hypothetical protein
MIAQALQQVTITCRNPATGGSEGSLIEFNNPYCAFQDLRKLTRRKGVSQPLKINRNLDIWYL